MVGCSMNQALVVPVSREVAGHPVVSTKKRKCFCGSEDDDCFVGSRMVEEEEAVSSGDYKWERVPTFVPRSKVRMALPYVIHHVLGYLGVSEGSPAVQLGRVKGFYVALQVECQFHSFVITQHAHRDPRLREEKNSQPSRAVSWRRMHCSAGVK